MFTMNPHLASNLMLELFALVLIPSICSEVVDYGHSVEPRDPPEVSGSHTFPGTVTTVQAADEPAFRLPTPLKTVTDGEINVTISEEKRLVRFLMRRYKLAGRGGRPVVNYTQNVKVLFGLGLIQMELNEKQKMLITSMWSRLMWRDKYMTWDPGDYGGVTSIRVESDDVWTPDIMLYNTADPGAAARDALVMVLPDGTLTWVPHSIFKSSCSIDVANFPFDNQTCTMWFGSWTHPISDIDLDLAFPDGIDLSTFKSDYKDSCEWDIVEPIAEKYALPENDTNPIAVLSFTLKLQRKVTFSSYMLTLPCIFLASLTLVVFWLPPDRPDRTGLAMSLFASFLVLLLILVEAAPPTASSVPTIGVYYSFNMVIIMLSIFLSSLVVHIHRGGENKRRVPKWLRVVAIDFLGCLCCACSRQPKPKKKFRKANLLEEEEGQKIVQPEQNNAPSHAWNHFPDHLQMKELNVESSENNSDYSSKLRVLERNCNRINKHLCDVRNILERIHTTTERKDAELSESRAIVREWKLVALAIDRFLFLVYLVSIILSLIYMFPRPPNWTMI